MIHWTETENQVFIVLAQHINKRLTYGFIVQQAKLPSVNALRTLIRRMRIKMSYEDTGFVIETSHMFGYRLAHKR